MRSLKVISPDNMVDGNWYKCLITNFDCDYDDWYFKFSKLNKEAVLTYECYSFGDDGTVYRNNNLGTLCHLEEIKEGSIKEIDYRLVRDKFIGCEENIGDSIL